MNGCVKFQQGLRHNASWFLYQHRTTIFLRGFNLKVKERPSVPLKNRTKHFQNGPPFLCDNYQKFRMFLIL